MNVRENGRRITTWATLKQKFVCLFFVFIHLEKFSSFSIAGEVLYRVCSAFTAIEH